LKISTNRQRWGVCFRRVGVFFAPRPPLVSGGWGPPCPPPPIEKSWLRHCYWWSGYKTDVRISRFRLWPSN